MVNDILHFARKIKYCKGNREILEDKLETAVARFVKTYFPGKEWGYMFDDNGNPCGIELSDGTGIEFDI